MCICHRSYIEPGVLSVLEFVHFISTVICSSGSFSSLLSRTVSLSAHTIPSAPGSHHFYSLPPSLPPSLPLPHAPDMCCQVLCTRCLPLHCLSSGISVHHFRICLSIFFLVISHVAQCNFIDFHYIDMVFVCNETINQMID